MSHHNISPLLILPLSSSDATLPVVDNVSSLRDEFDQRKQNAMLWLKTNIHLTKIILRWIYM